MKHWADVFALVVATVVILMLWNFIARPMTRNYVECGTVFPCSTQRNTR